MIADLLYIAARVWNHSYSKNICVHLWLCHRFVVLFHTRLSNAQFTLHQMELLLTMINSTFCEHSSALFVGNMRILSWNCETHENPQPRCPSSEQRFWSRTSIIQKWKLQYDTLTVTFSKNVYAQIVFIFRSVFLRRQLFVFYYCGFQ